MIKTNGIIVSTIFSEQYFIEILWNSIWVELWELKRRWENTNNSCDKLTCMMQNQDSKAKLITYSIVKIYDRKDVMLRIVGIE